MYKKLSLIFLLLVILFACQKEMKLSYDINTPVSVKWIAEESIAVDDTIILQALHDLLNGQALENAESFDVTDYEITVGDIRIRGNYVAVEDAYYQLMDVSENDLYTLLQDYIIEPVAIEDEEKVLDINLEDFTYLATLKDHSKIYYHDIGLYYQTAMADEILVIKDNELIIQEKGQMSIPDVSIDQMRFAYVSDVGFESLGTIKIFEDDQLKAYDTDHLLENLNENRTIKSFEWLDDHRGLAIVGYDSGTVTQGGDLYIVDLEEESIRLLLDAGKGFEIVKHSYDQELDFTMVTWVDDNYQFYRYIDSNIDISDLSNFPIRISWQPWNLSKLPLSETDIYSNPMFNPNMTKTDVLSLETTDQVNFYGEGYSVHFEGDQVSRIDIEGDYLLPRDIEIGQSLVEVLEKFPQEINYLENDDGYFYIHEDNEAQFKAVNEGYNLYFITEGPVLYLEFKWDKLVKGSVYFYPEEE